MVCSWFESRLSQQDVESLKFRRGKKKMFKFTIISVAAAALSSSALAGPILNIKFNVDGKKSTAIQEGDLTNFNDYSYTGSIGDGFPNATWVVGWDIASDFAARSFVTNGFTVANLGDTTKHFNILLDIPNTLPPGGGATPSWEFFGNLGGTLTSNSSEASTLSSVGTNPLWQGLRGGTSPGPNSQLMSSFTFSSPGSEASLIPTVTIVNYTVAGGLGSSLGYQFDFNLSANSTVSFTGIWGGNLIVPTPGVSALVGLAGIMVSRKRRQM